VSVRNAEGGIEIRVDASGAIEDYQKPELSGRSVILRFGGLSDATGGVSALAKHPAIRSAKLTSYRGTLILTVTLRKAPQAVRHRRLSASSVVFTVSGAEGGESVAATRSEQVQSAGQAEAADSGAARGGDKQAEKWKLDVVVLDAGHGGQDVGAIGLSGVYEKDITLAVTKKMAALLRKRRPEMKVVLTRSDDTFVELYRRTQIANEAGGKLFISLHCNSMPKKPHPAHGFEVYILRPGRDEDAARVADKENASVKFEKGSKAKYKALTREQFIVVTMAQKAFVKFSEMVGKELTRAAARATPLANRGINQAGFFVLVGASMPNVLVEMGFLSNAKDEEYLRSERGQNEIAESLVEGILNYEEQYDRSLRVGQD
jgi:N-acetylmuramoyl-L-alanine amidase